MGATALIRRHGLKARMQEPGVFSRAMNQQCIAMGEKTIAAVGGDRGFDSAANRELLREEEIFNGLCPRGAGELKRRRHGAQFNRMQRRRSQTGGRIGILKNTLLGQPLRVKGYPLRVQAIRSGGQTPRLYVSFPLALATAIGLAPGDEVPWELLDRRELRLVRLTSVLPRGQILD